MDNNYYTLVLYKSDGCNTCRQCVMEQWGSDFSLDSDISETDAINKIAETFAKKSDGGSYSAHLISIIDEKLDKYDHATITPTEKLVYEFDQYYDSSYKREVGGYRIKSYHHEDNDVLVEEDIKRINELIRSKVKEIQKTTNKK